MAALEAALRVLITGITGMVGSHLAEYVLDEHPGVEVHGLVRWRSPMGNVAAVKDRLVLHQGDLRDQASMLRVLKAARPDRIFHLAARSFVTTSYDAPGDAMDVNLGGTLHLLEAIRILRESRTPADSSWRFDPLVHVCSSSEVYGDVTPDEVPIRETHPFRPASPYAVSKAAADLLAGQYAATWGLRILRTRMFTHTGPRRAAVFAEGSFARQIAEREQGKASGPIRVGNLDSVRTFADVRDAVRAYWFLLEKCPPGEVYNIGGDRTMKVGDALWELKVLGPRVVAYQPKPPASRVDLPKFDEHIGLLPHVVDPTLVRPSDVTLQIPDSSKFKAATGWEPTIPFETTMRDLLDWHRAEVAAGR